MAADGDVAEIGRVSLMRSFLSVSVPAIGASTFWDAGYSGQGVSVAVLDSGIRSDHPAFSGLNVVPKVFLDNLKKDAAQGQVCLDPSDSDGSSIDRHGHGTHVAGIIASRGSTFWSDFQGVAKGLGTLYALKISQLSCDGESRSENADYVAALDWLV